MSAVLDQPTTEVTTQEQRPELPPNHVEMKFHFRTEKIRNEKNEVIGEGKKHPEVKAVLPIPSKEELIDFIAAGGKEYEFLQEAVQDQIKLAARAMINDFRDNNPDKEVTPDVFDLSKLTFTAIANMDKRDRAPEIPEEVWNAFFEDYKAVLTQLGQAPERVQKHVVLFKSQFRTARYDKPALSILKDRLNMWASKTENMEDHEDCFNVLNNKLDKYLKADEKNLVEAL
jgi:hypothetical protein